MSDPISRLQIARQEIDRLFGSGHAAANPELVAAVMQSAASDYAAQLIGSAIEHVAEALLVEKEQSCRPGSCCGCGRERRPRAA